MRADAHLSATFPSDISTPAPVAGGTQSTNLYLVVNVRLINDFIRCGQCTFDGCLVIDGGFFYAETAHTARSSAVPPRCLCLSRYPMQSREQHPAVRLGLIFKPPSLRLPAGSVTFSVVAVVIVDAVVMLRCCC